MVACLALRIVGSNLRSTGFPEPDSAVIRKWGIKWNAYDDEECEGDNTIQVRNCAVVTAAPTHARELHNPVVSTSHACMHSFILRGASPSRSFGPLRSGGVLP